MRSAWVWLAAVGSFDGRPRRRRAGLRAQARRAGLLNTYEQARRFDVQSLRAAANPRPWCRGTKFTTRLLAALLTLGALGMCSASAAYAAKGKTLEMWVVVPALNSSHHPTSDRSSAAACEAQGDYSYVAKGAPVVVGNKNGDAVGRGRLRAGYYDQDQSPLDCYFPLKLKVPRGLERYFFHVGDQNLGFFTHAELVKFEWEVDVDAIPAETPPQQVQETRTQEIDLSVIVDETHSSPNGRDSAPDSPCVATRPVAYVAEGQGVVVRDQDGKKVGEGTLGAGYYGTARSGATNCYFDTTISVPDVDTYHFDIGDHTDVDYYTHSELEQRDWRIGIIPR